MDNLWKAQQRLDTLASLVAGEICDLSSSMEDANHLCQRFLQAFQMRINLAVMNPDFQQRVLERHQEMMAKKITSETGILTCQLKQFGIDPAPVFADLPPGGDLPTIENTGTSNE